MAGTVPDYQMSAFAMAVYFKGMTTEGNFSYDHEDGPNGATV